MTYNPYDRDLGIWRGRSGAKRFETIVVDRMGVHFSPENVETVADWFARP